MIRTDPRVDPTVMVFSVGKLDPDQLESKIDSLLITEPEKIGVNLCHFDKIPRFLIYKYKSDNRVVFVNCEDSKSGSLSQILNDNGAVTHFRTDKEDYFEQTLTNFKGRGNNFERINYGTRLGYPINKGELNESYAWFNPEQLKGKTILLGYMGDYLTDSIYYYTSCRVTPLNSNYGESNIPPDMYDIELSAHILRTINENDFITEVNQIIRVLIILVFTLLNVSILTYAKTKWTIVNLIIAAILFIFLTGLGGFLMVLAFDHRYFLEMDELPLILMITTFSTIVLNINNERARAQQDT